jgi:hypothetical protein
VPVENKDEGVLEVPEPALVIEGSHGDLCHDSAPIVSVSSTSLKICKSGAEDWKWQARRIIVSQWALRAAHAATEKGAEYSRYFGLRRFSAHTAAGK